MGGISVLILMGILSGAFMFFIAIFIISIIYVIISYIFESIAIMCMCKNLEYKAPATAWIPFYNKYLLGKIIGNKTLGIILLISNILIMVSSIYSYTVIEANQIVFGIFLVCLLVSFILDIVIAHKIYKNVSNKYGDILTVLSVLSLGFFRPIILFILRNKITKMDKNKTMELK